MTRQLSVLFISISLLSCSHPEGKKYERNQGTKNEYNSPIEEINSILRDASLNGELVNQIYYSYDPELVSSDIIGNTCCSVYDSHATIVSTDGKNVVLYTWYDNEFGYTKQVIRLAKHICKVQRKIYY